MQFNLQNGSYFTWLTTSNEKNIYMVCNLWLHPGKLPGWMKNSYYSATAGIRTSDLPHSMIITMGK